MSKSAAPKNKNITTKALPKTSSQRQKSRLDFRWLVAGLIIIIALITAIAINTNHIINDSTKFANTLRIDNGDQNINWERYPTTDIELSEAVTTITESGTYHITGSQEDGMIVVSATSTDKVKLILDNVTLKHDDNIAILCYKADDLVIELVGTNTIADGTYTDDSGENIVSAIYANADLTFQGDGSLYLTGNSADGIVSTDDLKFNGGTYHITAQDDAIRGKDSVHIVDGNFKINASADAIKATNETDAGRGFILIENGNFNITSTAKGLKSTKHILINGGNFVLDTRDDAIHSDNYIGITGGELNITSGDDGIHANRELIIDNGKITIAKSYEALEAQKITINDGNISVVASDDGINAGGGNDNSATANDRPGAGPFDADENCLLTINGGNIYINASGDGIDSNGWVYFNGGNTIVDGPTNNGNGALDAGLGIVMNGGQVLALGSSGMAETLGSSSSVFNLSIYLSSTQPSGTAVKIQTSTGDTILEHTSAKSFSHVAAGSPSFQLGQSYTLYLDDEEYQTFTISSITTTVGNSQNDFHNFRK